MMLPKIQQHNGLPKAVMFIQTQQDKNIINYSYINQARCIEWGVNLHQGALLDFLLKLSIYQDAGENYIPINRGEIVMDNFQTLCLDCNRSKGVKTMNEWLGDNNESA